MPDRECVISVLFRANVAHDDSGLYSYRFKGVNFAHQAASGYTPVSLGASTRPSTNRTFLRFVTDTTVQRPLLRFTKFGDDPTNFVISEDAGQVEILGGLYDTTNQDHVVINKAINRVRYKCEVINPNPPSGEGGRATHTTDFTLQDNCAQTTAPNPVFGNSCKRQYRHGVSY